jgi:hypothetical protein
MRKKHNTVVLVYCTDGTKLLLLLIFKRKVMHSGKYHKEFLATLMPKDGWMNENGMKLWIEKVLSKCPGVLLKKPALLVCDQFRSHVTEATKWMVKELNTLLDVIPEGHTSQLQPFDVSSNCLKHSCVEWTRWLDAPNRDLTPAG